MSSRAHLFPAVVLAGLLLAQAGTAAGEDPASSAHPDRIPFNPLANLARLEWARYEYSTAVHRPGAAPTRPDSWTDRVIPTGTADGSFSWMIIDGSGQTERLKKGPVTASSISVKELFGALALSTASAYAKEPVPIVIERESVVPALVLWEGAYRPGFAVEVDAFRDYKTEDAQQQRFRLRARLSEECPAGVVEFEEVIDSLRHGRVSLTIVERWRLRELKKRS